MEMSGQHRIAAPREVVWEALNDPEILRQSIPGCQRVDQTSPTEMTATVTAKLGPVKASFSGKVTLTNMNPPESYTISGEGSGGAAGFASGGADVKLTPDGDGTILTYDVKASVGGKVAQLGARLVDGAARKMADDFFGRFAVLAEARAKEAPQGASAGEPIAAPAAPPPVAEADQAPAGAPPPTVQPVPGPAPAPVESPEPFVQPVAAEAPPEPEAAPAEAPPAPTPAPVPPVATAATTTPPPLPPESPVAGGAAAGRPAAPEPPRSGGVSPAIWIVGLIVIVVLLLWAFIG